MPNQGAQAYMPPTAEATGNINANPMNNQYMGTPSDMTASDNLPLANAVRNAPLDNAVAGANAQSAIPQAVNGQTTNPAIPAANQASADGMLPAVTVRPEPEPAQPSQLAQMLRGEGDYAHVRQAGVMDVPRVPSNFDRMTYVRMLGLANRNQEADREVKNIDSQLVADTARATAQMADLKVQREGILNREQARAIATERIEDNAKREEQRAQDKKEAAASQQAFIKSEHALQRSSTSEDRRAAIEAKPLSPVLARELNDADEATLSSRMVQKQLKAALDINDQAYSGLGSHARALVASNVANALPGGKPNAQADATIKLNNIITTQALESLKMTFGAAPTEGERKILLEIQGSVDKTPAQRKDIFDRAMAMAAAKEKFHTRKAEAIRSGTWSKTNYNPSEDTGGVKKYNPDTGKIE
jgi:hypothetical protein